MYHRFVLFGRPLHAVVGGELRPLGAADLKRIPAVGIEYQDALRIGPERLHVPAVRLDVVN
jgi:hypothetical protein